MMQELDRALWVDLVGLPYAHLGRADNGIDCFGLVMKIYARRGIIVPDVQYGLTDQARQDALSSSDNLSGWSRCDPQAGVAVTFRKRGYVQHCGVVIDDDRFIHSSEDHGGVVVGRLSRDGNFNLRMIAGFHDYRA